MKPKAPCAEGEVVVAFQLTRPVRSRRFRVRPLKGAHHGVGGPLPRGQEAGTARVTHQDGIAVGGGGRDGTPGPLTSEVRKDSWKACAMRTSVAKGLCWRQM